VKFSKVLNSSSLGETFSSSADNKRGRPLPRCYTSVPVADYIDDSPEDKNLWCSKRAQTIPFEFWRGEKPVYGANSFGDDYNCVKNSMPVVVAFAKAKPTPYKKCPVPAAVPKKKSGKQSATEGVAAPAAADEPFDTSRLRRKLKINDGKIAQLWDKRYQDMRSISKYHFSAGSSTNCWMLHLAFCSSLSHVHAYSLSQRLCRTRLQQKPTICQCSGHARRLRAKLVGKHRNHSMCLTKRTLSS
jgi:hypothetical protein